MVRPAQQNRGSRQGRWKRSIWVYVVIGAVAIGALMRLVVAVSGAGRLPASPLEITGLDALVGGLLLAALAVAVVILSVNKASARRLVAVRRKSPDRPV